MRILDRRKVCRAGGLLCLLVGIAAGMPSPAGAADTWSGGGPEGGWITAILVPFGPGGFVYAGSYGGGVWESRDGGTSWQTAMNQPVGVVVADLEIGSDFENSLYAATSGHGVLRAPLGARIWTPVNTGLNEPFLPLIFGVAAHPTRPLRIVVATEFGIFASNDRGNSYPDSLHWGPGISMVDTKIHPLRPNSVIALSAQELFLATPVHWGFQVQSLGFRSGSQFVDLAMWPTSPDTVLALGRREGLIAWAPQGGFRARGPDPPGFSPPIFHALQVVEGSPPRVLVGSDVGLFETADLGQSWQLREGGGPARIPEIWAVESPDPTSPQLLLGSFTRGVLAEDAPGQPWREQNQGLRATWARALHLGPDGWLSGDAHGRVHRSVDQGESWVEVTGDLDILQIRSVLQPREGGAWIVGSLSGLYRSTDGGAHWTSRSLPNGHGAVHRLLQPDWMDPAEVWAATDRGVLRSLDAGLTWTGVEGLANLGRAVFAAAAGPDSALAFGPDGTGLWWGRPGRGFEFVIPPTNLGWRYRGLAFLGAGSSSLLISSALPGDLTDPNRGGVVYRVDGALGPSPQWVDLTDRLQAAFPAGGDAASIVDGSTTTALVALEGEGLMSTRDFGVNWQRLDAGLPTPAIERIAIAPGPPARVAVSTLGRGIWSRRLARSVPTLVRSFSARREAGAVLLEIELSEAVPAELWRRTDAQEYRRWRQLEAAVRTVLVDAGSDIGEGLSYELRRGAQVLGRARVAPQSLLRTELLANVPNPFNPRTLVRWRAPTGRLRVDVYDLRGRRLRILFDGEFAGGERSLVFDGRDDQGVELASGVYVVRLAGAQGEDARRVTLLR